MLANELKPGYEHRGPAGERIYTITDIDGVNGDGDLVVRVRCADGSDDTRLFYPEQEVTNIFPPCGHHSYKKGE